MSPEFQQGTIRQNESTNVLRLSAGMNRSLIAKFAKKIKSNQILANGIMSKTQEDGEKPQRRVDPAGKSCPSIANIDDAKVKAGEGVTSPKGNV